MVVGELKWKCVIFGDPKSTSTSFYEYPPKSGAYVIAENYTEPRYVGKGIISNRISVHKSDKEQNSKLKKLMTAPFKNNVQIAYALCSDSDSKDVERTLYEKYGGKEKLYNENEPDGDKITGIKFPKLEKE